MGRAGGESPLRRGPLLCPGGGRRETAEELPNRQKAPGDFEQFMKICLAGKSFVDVSI